MKDRKITVLGQEYVIEQHYHKDDPRLEGLNGYLAPFEKKIVIASEIVDKAEGRNLESDDTGRIDIYIYVTYTVTRLCTRSLTKAELPINMIVMRKISLLTGLQDSIRRLRRYLQN